MNCRFCSSASASSKEDTSPNWVSRPARISSVRRARFWASEVSAARVASVICGTRYTNSTMPDTIKLSVETVASIRLK